MSSLLLLYGFFFLFLPHLFFLSKGQRKILHVISESSFVWPHGYNLFKLGRWSLLMIVSWSIITTVDVKHIYINRYSSLHFIPFLSQICWYFVTLSMPVCLCHLSHQIRWYRHLHLCRPCFLIQWTPERRTYPLKYII